jgi:hypothetical protein
MKCLTDDRINKRQNGVLVHGFTTQKYSTFYHHKQQTEIILNIYIFPIICLNKTITFILQQNAWTSLISMTFFYISVGFIPLTGPPTFAAYSIHTYCRNAISYNVAKAISE